MILGDCLTIFGVLLPPLTLLVGFIRNMYVKRIEALEAETVSLYELAIVSAKDSEETRDALLDVVRERGRKK